MSEKEQMRSLVKEARLYQEQGLLAESKAKYMAALEIVRENRASCNAETMIPAIEEWIQGVENALIDINQATTSPRLENELQDLIRSSFSFSSNRDTAAIEGAMALAKFGQYERALAEFHRLMDKGILPFAAARNIIACLGAMSLPDAAVAQYRQWVSRNTLPKGELEYIRVFLENMLENEGIKRNVSSPGNMPSGPETCWPKDKEEPLLEISLVSVRFEEGPMRDRVMDFQVTFQSGNVISAVVPAQQEDLSDIFAPGIRFSELECYSPSALLRCGGMVFGKTRISNGPDQGGYLLDITLDGRGLKGAAPP